MFTVIQKKKKKGVDFILLDLLGIWRFSASNVTFLTREKFV